MTRTPFFQRCALAMTASASMLVFAALSPAQAQENDALRFFQQNPGRSLFRAAPPQRLTPRPAEGTRRIMRRTADDEDADAPQRRRRPATPTWAAPAAASGTSAAPPAPVIADKPNVPPSFFVHVMGDSLGELMSSGLTEQVSEKSEIAIIRNTRSSSGLVRQDYHDWAKVLKDLIDKKERIDMVVMMVGSNDRQPIRDDAGNQEFRSEAWTAAYAKRVDAIVALAREAKVKLVWVGVPMMQSQKFSADMLFLNTQFRERLSRSGVPYVDLWEAFANDQGQYASVGPSVIGEIVRLRTTDGVHFTKAGGRKAGFFVAKEIEAELQRRRSDPALASLVPSSAVPGAIPAQPAIVLPDTVPGLGAALSQRPLAGAIMSLNAPPVTVGAALLSRRTQPPSNEMQILVDQALGYGRLPLPKPGRADDFRWPRS